MEPPWWRSRQLPWMACHHHHHRSLHRNPTQQNKLDHSSSSWWTSSTSFHHFSCPCCSCHFSCSDNWRWYDPLYHIRSKSCQQKDFSLTIILSCQSSSCSSFYWTSWQRKPSPHPILLLDNHFLLHFSYLESWKQHFTFFHQFLHHELHLEISWTCHG